MFLMFSFLFATQMEQKDAFLAKIEGFNLSEYATWTPPDKQEKSSLYLPYCCWLEPERAHITRDTHRCTQHGVMCFSISNGDTGKTLFFDALQKKQFNSWHHSEFKQDCEILASQLQNLEQPSTIVEIFCYKQRFSTDLNTSFFNTCLAGTAYYRTQEQEEEDRLARIKQMGSQGMSTTSGEFIPTAMLTNYFQRTSQCF